MSAEVLAVLAGLTAQTFAIMFFLLKIQHIVSTQQMEIKAIQTQIQEINGQLQVMQTARGRRDGD